MYPYVHTYVRRRYNIGNKDLLYDAYVDPNATKLLRVIQKILSVGKYWLDETFFASTTQPTIQWNQAASV